MKLLQLPENLVKERYDIVFCVQLPAHDKQEMQNSDTCQKLTETIERTVSSNLVKNQVEGFFGFLIFMRIHA